MPAFLATILVESVRCRDCGASDLASSEAEAVAWAQAHNAQSPACTRIEPRPGLQYQILDA